MSDAKKEYESILEQLSDPELIADWEKFERLNKKKAALEKILEKEKEIQEIGKKIEENKAIIAAGEDSDLVSLAQTEIAQLQEMKNKLEDSIKESTDQETKEDESTADQAAIVEIRAGTGGDEAALFVANMFRMYARYGEHHGLKVRVLDSRPTELGGFKEIVLEMSNGSAYSQLQYEGGVHRVQRIPRTEKMGRVHTSTVSVAVLPKPKKTEVNIRQDQLRIDYYRASGPGGQYVNKRETAVRITHLPTGIVVSSQTERNQLQNKENALSILSAKVLEKREQKQLEKMGNKRKSQIGQAKRAEKIRTYNFPQDRVTDHRIKKTFHNIEGILDGHLDQIIKALEETKN